LGALGALIGCQAPIDDPLPAGGAITGALTAGQAQTIDLTLAPDTLLELAFEQDARQALRLEVRSDDGDRLWQRVGPPMQMLAPDGGHYRVRINAAATLDGAARFTIRRLPARAVEVSERRTLALARSLRRIDGAPTTAIGRATSRAEYAALLPVAELLGQDARVIDVLLVFASLDSDDGDAAAARRHATAARARAIAVDDAKGLADSAERLGELALGAGALDEAQAQFDAQIAAAHRIPDPRREAFGLSNRATVDHDRGDLGAGIARLETARGLLERLGTAAADLAGLDLDLSAYYSLLGDDEAALRHAAQAEAGARAIGRTATASMAAANAGFIYLQQLDDPAAALAAFTRARPGLRDQPLDDANLVDALAKAELALGHAARARALLDLALPVIVAAGDRRREAEVRRDRGLTALALGEPARAELDQSLALSVAIDDPRYVIEAQVGLARAAAAAGDVATARQWFDRALAGAERLRDRTPAAELRTTYFAVVRAIYEPYIELLWSAGDRAGAYALAQRARARSLIDALDHPLPIRDEATVAAASRGAAIIEFAIGPTRTLVWRFVDGAVAHVELPGRRALAASVRAYHDAILARVAAATEADRAQADARVEVEGAALAAVLGPALAGLAPGPTIIVPDGPLFLVPWAGLPDGRGGHFGDGHDLALVPALAWARAPTRPGPDRLELAVLADPVFTAADARVVGVAAWAPSAAPPLARLRGARDEAVAIAAAVPTGRVRIALDFDASLATLADPAVRGARILHFATHAVIDDQVSARSRLELARVDAAGQPVDGALDVARVRALHLGAELVVLSACETALGRQIRGEGVVGLVHAFLVAGADRVVASLWPVDDQATAALMRAFYAALLVDHLAPAAALARAQRHIAADPRWRAPYFWAAFVIVGAA
jgi:CHAT domain-containing protein/tetratricopeptide (TPR) repeat protein